MPTILQDVRYATRQLRRSPGFAATVILTMALGIGANSTVFGVIDAVVHRPLNLPNPSSSSRSSTSATATVFHFTPTPTTATFKQRFLL